MVWSILKSVLSHIYVLNKTPKGAVLKHNFNKSAKKISLLREMFGNDSS